MKRKEKTEKRIRRHKRARAKIEGTSLCPRLSVFRSSKHIFAQLVDDRENKTLLQISDLKMKTRVKETKKDVAFKIGEELAKLAKTKKIKRVVFDRGGYLYHGRVKALAEGARKGGLEF